MKIKVSPYVAERIIRRRNQFRVDTFRCGGNGGQNVNKVESGVRITDLVTGIASEGRETRDQGKNKRAAFRRLVHKLIEHYEKLEKGEIVKDLGPARAIRTYNIGQNRVTDHRIGKSYSVQQVLKGDLDEIITDVRTALVETDVIH